MTAGLAVGDDVIAALCTVVLIVVVNAATGIFTAGGPFAVRIYTTIRALPPSEQMKLLKRLTSVPVSAVFPIGKHRLEVFIFGEPG